MTIDSLLLLGLAPLVALIAGLLAWRARRARIRVARRREPHGPCAG